jgi:hypothetical protein
LAGAGRRKLARGRAQQAKDRETGS